MSDAKQRLPAAANHSTFLLARLPVNVSIIPSAGNRVI
jgi:hypothetical protein